MRKIKIIPKSSHLDMQPPPDPARPLRLRESVEGVGAKPPFKLGDDSQGGEGMVGCYWGGMRLRRRIWCIVECCFSISPPRVSNYWPHHAQRHKVGTSIGGGVTNTEGAFLLQFSVKGRKLTLCVSRSVIGLIRNVRMLRRREHS